MALNQVNVRQETSVLMMKKSMDQAEANRKISVKVIQEFVVKVVGKSVRPSIGRESSGFKAVENLKCIQGVKMKKVIVYGLITLLISLIGFPMLFNYLILWDSGYSKGKISDWFVLYGNVIGGLISGFFTYLAVTLTINFERKRKEEEKAPCLEVLSQNIKVEEIDGSILINNIELDIQNTGGSLAKNIEYRISSPNHNEMIRTIKSFEKELYSKEGITVTWGEVKKLSNIMQQDEENMETILQYRSEDKPSISLGLIEKEYAPQFLGTAIPLILNNKSVISLTINPNLTKWIYFYIKFIESDFKDLFNLDLEISYEDLHSQKIIERFKITWIPQPTIVNEIENLWIYQYILKSEKQL